MRRPRSCLSRCSSSSRGLASSPPIGARPISICCMSGAWADAASAPSSPGSYSAAISIPPTPSSPCRRWSYGKGAIGFFAVPYTVMIYPILYAMFPRLWQVTHAKGHVTAADFVRDRFDSRMLALAIAVTGVVATMPYIALQLVGMEVVIGALGFPTQGFVGHLPLIIAFLILAAFTYKSGLRAPALIAVVKDVLIFITVIAAVIVIPAKLGGYGAIFAKVPNRNCCCPSLPDQASDPTAPISRSRSARPWRCSSILIP